MSSHIAQRDDQPNRRYIRIRDDDKVSEQQSSATSSSPVSKRNLIAAITSVVLIVVLIAVCIGCHVYRISSSPNDPHKLANGRPVVAIAQGQLRGYKTKAGPYLFNNIPFAQPPVGKLRWLPPQLPPPSWTGVRDAEGVSNMCVQASDGDPTNGRAKGSEDCLYLNVYTKRIVVANNGTNSSTTSIVNPDKRLSPVLVFVHGGSSISGWSSIDLYDHQKLVANRDVVAVTVNYRLNVFGYLALDVLTLNQYNFTGLRTSGNYGLLDNIAALKWVKANIAAFGGDPNSITIYGQSTGGTNVVCLYMSPLARGLFDAVLALSASPVLKGDLAFASKQNEPFLSLSGCDNKSSEEATLDCIYALSPQAVLSAMPPPWLNSTDVGLVNFGWPDAAVIIVDEYVVPREINTALSHGAGAEVVIDYGHMAQEIDFLPIQQPIMYNQTQFAQWLTDLTPTLSWNATQTQKVIEMYPISDYGNDSLLTYESFVNDCIVCASLVNLNMTSTSQPRHNSKIFHHIIHYHPSVPTEYFRPTGWPVAYAGHAWDLLLLLETYPDAYPVTPLDRQHTELLRKLWIDQLTTKLTITDTEMWPAYNEAQLSGQANSTWSLELLQLDESMRSPGYVATANYHGDKCALLRDYGFAYAAWAN